MDDQFTPYCFILDDAYRVLMAGPCDPAEAASTTAAPVGSLPAPIDRAVRALTASWKSDIAGGSNAKISGLHLSIAPVPGSDGPRIAVFVRRALATYA
ncbi:MAG TPA: hypothetical protein VIG46_03585 [Candidatus Baltobacteraceae bacterium]|jgi:hypothetical protein